VVAGALNLLRDITAFVAATRQPSSADKPVRLAVVDSGYTTGWPKVTFEGESTLSGKQYPHIDSYAPAAGDRVVLVPVGTTYLIVGAVSSTGAGQPAGAIQAYAGSTAPPGWLACDGSAVSRTTYSRLFAAIGTTWGAGNGSTTFNVPDLRGRAPIGAGTGSGLTARTLAATGGAETVTLTTTEMPAHSHTFSSGTAASDGDHSHSLSGTASSAGSHTHSVSNQGTRSDILAGGGTTTAATGSGSTGSDGSHSHSLSATASTAGAHTHSVTGTNSSEGSGGAHANMQPWAAVTYLIKT
jgi:microcystin-dependent protein